MAQIYPVKSNAARAAKKFGLTRNDLFAVPGGWTFETPEEKAAINAQAFGPASLPVAPSPAPAATVAPIAPELALTAPEAPIKARATPFVGERQAPAPGDPEPVAPVAKAGGRKAKRARATKPKRARPKAAGIGRRRSGPNTGVCDSVIAAIKARWTPVPELLKLSGWLPHTLRGYISTRASKDGFTVERKRVDGVTSYRIAA